MRNDDELKQKMKGNLMRMIFEVQIVAVITFVVFAAIFLDFLPTAAALPIMFTAAAISFVIVRNRLRCPNCDAVLLTKENMAANGVCANCGIELNNRQEEQRALIEKVAKTPAAEHLARTTGWSPLNVGSASFNTVRLHEDANGRLVFRSTIGLYLFGGLFIVSIAPILYFMDFRLESLGRLWEAAPFTLALALTFPLMGLLIFYWLAKPAYVDLGEGVFRKGWSLARLGTPREIPLYEIKAIQLLSAPASEYSNFQLNLVLQDSERVHVTNYASEQAALEDAEKLSDFLNIPLWNALEAFSSPADANDMLNKLV